MMRHRIAALCPVQPEHRCKALANTPPPEDRGRNERSQSLSLRSAPGVIPLSLVVAEGYGKAADSGSIIRIDPKSAVYVSDIRPQWVEITSSTACRISATARWRRNTKRKSPTIAAEDNLCCMISCFRVYILQRLSLVSRYSCMPSTTSTLTFLPPEKFQATDMPMY